MTGARRLLDAATSEAELQSNVLQLAGHLGWLSYHPFDSRRSAAGFPDLVLVRGDRLIAAELKRERGRPTSEQRHWLAALAAVTTASAHLWRPSDLAGDRGGVAMSSTRAEGGGRGLHGATRRPAGNPRPRFIHTVQHSRRCLKAPTR